MIFYTHGCMVQYCAKPRPNRHNVAKKDKQTHGKHPPKADVTEPNLFCQN